MEALEERCESLEEEREAEEGEANESEWIVSRRSTTTVVSF